ncbi:hypothetical protein EDC04DRAFT_256844 [Pisolithus marmoratus]|nr:hypothetical protein EDC04DRAFT_256844 [Pisolithus marmoratus]
MWNQEMPEGWYLPDQRRLVRVPRPPVCMASNQTQPPITFSTNGWPGVRVRDILDGTLRVDTPYDMPFLRFGWRSTRISLEWPGHAYRSKGDLQCARIETHAGPEQQPITRRELAKIICGMLRNFAESKQNQPVVPEYERWSLQHGRVRLCEVFLLSIHYYTDHWVPEFYVFKSVVA